ncbi:S6 family peptidase [Streptobacillus felis]|uniref:S6 family peptidase n=1 Tax=Streptobacillus felis TaxID=1384509 RepID=UPI000832E5B5|nr:S6 family peptidase [Streptobacillus felis]
MNKKITLLLIIESIFSYSGALRYDIPFIDYQSFALNNGKFKVGNENINIYKYDGTKVGIIEKMPNFDGVNKEANYSYLDDPQILSGVKHIGNLHFGYEFLSRHIRRDVNLYENNNNIFSKNDSELTTEEYYRRRNEIKKFSEIAEGKEYMPIGTDWAIVRLDRVLHDGTQNEVLYDLSKLSIGDLVARMGRGNTTISNENGTMTRVNRTYTGGLNKITYFASDPFETRINISFSRIPVTVMDIGTNNGDSGSPLFWWDKDNKKWLYLANNSAGNGASETNPWHVYSVLRSNVSKYKEIKNKTNSNEISNAYNVVFNNNKLIVDGKEIYFDKNFINDDTSLNFYKVKNQVFNIPNLTIQVLSKTNTNEARLEFKEDTKIDGIADLKAAGYVVAEGKTLTYKLKINEGNVVRKIGKGTLHVNSTGNNEGDINIGEGTLVLSNAGGYGAKNVRVAKGATVKIMSADQLNKNNIYFGLRGGKLDLNGNNLNFEDIYHIDSDAEINNSNSQKSNFTLSAKGEQDRVYLGSFKGNLDVTYTPTNETKWELRGNSEINGNLNINKGKVKVIGDNVIVGADNDVLENEYIRARFKSNEVSVNTNLEIGRAAEIESNINVKNGARLDANLEGIVKDKQGKLDFVNGKTEEEINKSKILGNINFENNNTFNMNVENNNKLEIDAKLSGSANITKKGDGVAEINSKDNSIAGNITVEKGRLKVEEKTSLGNTVSLINGNAILEVENRVDFSNLLDRIDKNSSGVLSLGEDVPILDTKYKNYPKLYLGTTKNITIGSDNIKISDEIKTINLGGDNGSVTLKGMHLSKDAKNINIEDGTKVLIDKVLDDNKFKFVVKNGSVNIREILTKNRIIDLQYGNFADYSSNDIILQNSEGVLELENENTSETDMYIGAKENTTVTVNNITTSGDYKLSGRGNLIVNSNLLDKNIVVDGQRSTSGTVKINTENPSYTGNITVMGNREGSENGNITLIVDKENVLGKDNKFLIKDGGVLDVKGTKLNLKLDDANNQRGSIVNSGSGISELNLLVENNLKINNLISGDIKVIKRGNADLEFINIDNKLKELDITSGTLNVNVNALKGTNINIKENTRANINIDANMKTVNNEGTINLNDSVLTLDKYNPSKTSIINLFLNNRESLLNINSTDSSEKVNMNIYLGSNINKDKEIVIGSLPNEINLLNSSDLSNMYRYKLVKRDMLALLTKIIEEKQVNKLWFLNELNLLSSSVTPSKFESGIYASFVNYTKKDNKEDSIYKNDLSSNGVKLNLEILNKVKNIDILSGFDFSTMYTSVTTKTEDKDVDSRFLVTEILPKIGVKYGMFRVEGRLGYINVYDTVNSKNIHMIKHNLDLYINPVFKVTKDLDIEYMNTLGYVINPIISSNYEETIENASPFSGRYITGVKLKHKYVDTFFDVDLGFNLAKINIKKDNDVLENTYTDMLRTKFSLGLDGKPTKNILINAKFGLNLNRNTYSSYNFDLGFGYKW